MILQENEAVSRRTGGTAANATSAAKIKGLIQDVQTRWNSTYGMLERAYEMREYIDTWLLESEMKFRVLRLTSQEWQQVKHIIELLQPFQLITESLSSTCEPSIHKAWTVYNVMHAHLEAQARSLVNGISRSWTNQLKGGIHEAKNKLAEYYGATADKGGLYFNIGICLNPCSKLDFYCVSVY